MPYRGACLGPTEDHHHYLIIGLIIGLIPHLCYPIIAAAQQISNEGQHKTGAIYRLPELVVHANRSYLTKGEETRLECRLHYGHHRGRYHHPQPPHAQKRTQQQENADWAENATLDRIFWLKDGSPVDEALGNSAAHESRSLSHHRTTDRAYTLDENGASITLHLSNYLIEGDYQCSAIVRNVPLRPASSASTTAPPLPSISSPIRHIDTRLVSAPLKLRRARITKFERYQTETVRVEQGQVARLPCLGAPDVIPGPPEVWFEKHGHEGVALGRTGNERFIATPTGLQIALAQPSDSGRYYCVVRNYHTNQTRKASKPIVLLVEPPQAGAAVAAALPTVVWPQGLWNFTRDPIEYHVVQGQMALLECVVWNAKVVWNKPDFSMPAVSLTDDRQRIRQIWGNLRFRPVMMEDAGEYLCHGLEPRAGTRISSTDLSEPSHPRVRYRLIVHAPTSVRLVLAQQLHGEGRSAWQLSCYAHHLRYEIPMVYVNGIPLIDSMEEMGIQAAEANFYTNPINVTLRAGRESGSPLSGSIQCISRPAMEEAEVYGHGLERGRAMNLYVEPTQTGYASTATTHVKPTTGRTNSARQLQTQTRSPTSAIVHDSRVRGGSAAAEERGTHSAPTFAPSLHSTTEQRKITNPPVTLSRPVVFQTNSDGAPTIRVQWDLRTADSPLAAVGDASHHRPQFSNFRIEARPLNEKGSANGGNGEWMLVDTAQPHVRAVSIKADLRKGSVHFQPGVEYQFRVGALTGTADEPSLYSEPSESLLVVEAAKSTGGGVHHAETGAKTSMGATTLLPPPEILRIQPISYDSLLVEWRYPPSIPHRRHGNEAPARFLVNYGPPRSGETEGSGGGGGILLWPYSAPEEQQVEVESGAGEVLLTELEPDTEYRIEVMAETASGEKSEPSAPRIVRTYDLPQSESPSGQKRPTLWMRLRRDFLPREVGVRFLMLCTLLLIAAALLALLCVLTASRIKELRRHQHVRRQRQQPRQSRRNRRRRRKGSFGGLSSESSSDKAFGGSPQSHSSTHRLGVSPSKAKPLLYHEPCFFASGGDPLADLSPLGYESGLGSRSPYTGAAVGGLNNEAYPMATLMRQRNGTLGRSMKKLHQGELMSCNAMEEEKEDDIYTSRLQLASERKRRREGVAGMANSGMESSQPNLYGNAEADLESPKTVYPAKIYINPMPMGLTTPLHQSDLSNANLVGFPLKRADSMLSAASTSGHSVMPPSMPAREQGPQQILTEITAGAMYGEINLAGKSSLLDHGSDLGMTMAGVNLRTLAFHCQDSGMGSATILHSSSPSSVASKSPATSSRTSASLTPNHQALPQPPVLPYLSHHRQESNWKETVLSNMGAAAMPSPPAMSAVGQLTLVNSGYPTRYCSTSSVNGSTNGIGLSTFTTVNSPASLRRPIQQSMAGGRECTRLIEGGTMSRSLTKALGRVGVD